MVDGSSPSGSEVPQEFKEIKESPEKQAEIREAAEEIEKLDDATLNPEATLERGDYKAAEALETAFVEAVEATHGADEVSATPIPLPGEAREGPEDVKLEDGRPKTEDREGQMASEDEISATPINTPGGSDEISCNPVPIPAPAREGSDDEISATPIPLPGEGPDMKGSDEISNLPLPLPGPALEGNAEISTDAALEESSDEISATPINTPVDADMLSKPATDGDPKPPVGADMLSKPATDGDPKPPVGVDGITDVLLTDDVLNGIIRIEQQLSYSDQEKSQQASNKFQEYIISSNEPNDYYNLATEAVQEQFGDIEQFESDAQVVVLLSRTSHVIQVELDGINQELNEYSDDKDESDERLNSIGDDAQLSNIDLQNMLQKQQQTIQMLSNVSKVLHDTALAVIRKIG